MLPIIIVAIIAAALAIGAYQLVIQKYYWGPKGPPKKNGQQKDSRYTRS
ncbi:MAG TPA: hypothetical protein VGN95_10695 [Pyrinomonadaceae bacterium]|nr:hypothetical protein [Pyrinomonadaceae bacterium]